MHDDKGYALTKEEYLFLENGGDVEEMLRREENETVAVDSFDRLSDTGIIPVGWVGIYQIWTGQSEWNFF